jgi:hypothetical protein
VGTGAAAVKQQENNGEAKKQNSLSLVGDQLLQYTR